jgi:hypothetical protein
VNLFPKVIFILQSQKQYHKTKSFGFGACLCTMLACLSLQCWLELRQKQQSEQSEQAKGQRPLKIKLYKEMSTASKSVHHRI